MPVNAVFLASQGVENNTLLFDPFFFVSLNCLKTGQKTKNVPCKLKFHQRRYAILVYAFWISHRDLAGSINSPS